MGLGRLTRRVLVAGISGMLFSIRGVQSDQPVLAQTDSDLVALCGEYQDFHSLAAAREYAQSEISKLLFVNHSLLENTERRIVSATAPQWGGLVITAATITNPLLTQFRVRVDSIQVGKEGVAELLSLIAERDARESTEE